MQQAPAQRPPADDRLAKFVSTVLADTEDVWKDVFSKGGKAYQNSRQILENGDVEEAMNAAARIGDDALQRAGGGAVVLPDSFTHGTSAQRQRWFNTGLQGGSVKGCDTFSARNL